MTKKTTKRALIVSILSLILCFTMLVGTTFAWFADSVTSGKNRIVAGNLDVELEYLKDGKWETVSENTNVFEDGTLWEPGHTEVVYLKVRNAGTLALKYKLGVNVASEVLSVNVKGELLKLSDYIMVGVVDGQSTAFDNRDAARAAFDANDAKAINEGYAKNGELVAAGKGTSEENIALVVYIPEIVGNEANHKTGEKTPEILLGIDLYATQLMAESDSFGNDYDENAQYPTTTDTWDGTADTSWYNGTDTEFTIYTAEQLAGLAELVDDGNTFEGKTVKLGTDVDLNSLLFEPIGSYRQDKSFMGTFDGQNHTIKNLSQNTWELDNGYYYSDLGLGLFGKVEDAEIKNLNMDGTNISGESGIVGIVAATAYGDCTFENITVTNSQGADYQYYAGGIVGWASGDHQYINCDVDATTTIGSQWGDFGNASGGIIGGASKSATIYMKDCDVACRIDAVNDVVSAYQWYAYRNCGMLIGRTNHTTTNDAVTHAAAPNLTCENVTVTYGEWANYTYCEFAGTGYPYVRVQAGTSVDAYSNVRYGHPTDANGNQVVDDNHVHNEGEDHHILIAFDQLYGGPAEQHYCTYGTATHDGVTVIYNNK